MNLPIKFAPRLALVLLLVMKPMLSAAQGAAFKLTSLALPVAENSAQPDLASSTDGGLLLSWVEKLESGHRLRFSRLLDPADSDGHASTAMHWSPAQTVASGDDWFVNWADTPHLIAFRDGTLWAHWLRKNGSGVYDYGVALVNSTDQGRTWSSPLRLEPQGARLDYGFVSLWEDQDHSLGVAWLDSRQKQVPEVGHGEHHEHGGGAMMLRAARFDANGKRTDEWALDSATCDCCPTSVAATDAGIVLVYRGRTTDEIRDIQLTRFDDPHWTKPVTVHVDNWKFAGCPVNGPAVAASGNDVWVAWYTEADGQPSVRLARSSDAGDVFDEPRQLANGNGVLGRVNLALDARNLWVTWLVEAREGNTQQLMLARFDARSGKQIQQGSVATLAARGHASGLPQIQVHDGEAWLVWTDIVGGQLQLRGVRARPNA